MFIHDLKNDFYNTLRGKRILVIVNYDIDAICASKILQTLFRYDHMVYSIVPIMGIAGLQRAYNENKDDVKNVMLINCGVCLDIVDLLQPDDDVTFYICDSHRPMDVCNVYSDSQVRVHIVRRTIDASKRNLYNLFTSRYEFWANRAMMTRFQRLKRFSVMTTMPMMTMMMMVKRIRTKRMAKQRTEPTASNAT